MQVRSTDAAHESKRRKSPLVILWHVLASGQTLGLLLSNSTALIMLELPSRGQVWETSMSVDTPLSEKKESYDGQEHPLAGTRYAPTQPRTERKNVMNYATYLLSPEWRAIRQVKLKETSHKCEGCSNVSHLQIHHLTYKRIGHERMSDLMVLCDKCHAQVHEMWRKMPKFTVPQIRHCILHFLLYCKNRNKKRNDSKVREKVNSRHNKLPQKVKRFLAASKAAWEYLYNQ